MPSDEGQAQVTCVGVMSVTMQEYSLNSTTTGAVVSLSFGFGPQVEYRGVGSSVQSEAQHEKQILTENLNEQLVDNLYRYKTKS